MDDLELLVFLLPLSECWDDKYGQSCPVSVGLEVKPTALMHIRQVVYRPLHAQPIGACSLGGMALGTYSPQVSLSKVPFAPGGKTVLIPIVRFREGPVSNSTRL